MYVQITKAHPRLRYPRSSAQFLGETETGGLHGFSPSEEKAIRITDAFENTSFYTKYRTLSFRGLTGDFDGQGLSFGLLQWNIGKGSLQPLLREFDNDHPQRFGTIFGPDAAQLRAVLGQPKTQQLEWARSINDYGNSKRPRIREPWASYFRRLGDDPAFQRIQLKSVWVRMDSAIKYARQLGLESERGLALMFDIVTQQGQYWLTCSKPSCRERKRLMEERRSKRQRELGRPLRERELLEIIANVIADVAKPRWRHNVRVRKMTIVTGRGTVHGHDFDLEREFGLTDQPWQSAASTAPTTTTTAGRSLSQRIQDAVRQGQWYLALTLAVLLGERDANKLTNMVFFARHPERAGRKLEQSEVNFRQLSQEWLDIQNRLVRPFLEKQKLTPPVSPTKPPAPPKVPSKAKCVQAGSCTACERRLHVAPAPQLVAVPKELKFVKRPEQLDVRALQAYQQIVQAARAEGIASPYLKLVSGYRPYAKQAELWRKRLLARFKRLGCPASSLPCIESAIDRTTSALESKPTPHARDAWLERFLEELAQARCALNCDPKEVVKELRKGTAPPGHSPHHTGRAIDIHVGGQISTEAANVAYQRQQAAYRWLVCNAERFGFYPYRREPWHWEYNPPA